MAERRKNKKKKEVDVKIDDKPSKEEYAVAKFLKQSLPEKKTTLLGHKVEYFIASKAVDCLVESHWAKDNKKGDLNFSNRDVAVDFMARLLEHKFFHRAKKIVVQKEPKKKKKETEDAAQESGKEKETKKCEKASKTEGEKISKAEGEKTSKTDGEKTSKTEGEKSSKAEGEKTNKTEAEKTDDKETKKESGEIVEKKKEKKKIKLDMHLEQLFIDSNEPYVWIYDPIPLRTWITGTLMVVAAVLLCLFPLWPQTIRHYIYYLSVAAAFFLVFIIGLAVLRVVVFVLVWIVTFGKHHLWLLPNLTEDVGFFESFWPLYHYEYKGFKPKDTKSSGSKKEEETPKNEDSPEEVKKEKEHKESPKVKKEKESESPDIEVCEKESENPDQSQSESDQEEEEKSESEAHKTDNGFEFLEADEVSDSAEEEEDRKTK